MNTRTLGKNGPGLTVIGFGAWAIGGPWLYGWGPVDDEASVKAIKKALDLGINWIDTAAVYGLGHSEEIVGKTIAGIRDKVFLATKCGMVWDEKRNVKISVTIWQCQERGSNFVKALSCLRQLFLADNIYFKHCPIAATLP